MVDHLLPVIASVSMSLEIMKSTLNPYAKAFVPLSEKHGSAVASTWSHEVNKQNQGSPRSGVASPKFINHGGNQQSRNQDWTQGQKNQGSSGSSFVIPNGMTAQEYLDEASEMDLAYLGGLFPGLSEQSIGYIYSACGDDVDAAVLMLKQVEDPAESSQQLPDTLDIGDESPPELKYQAAVAEPKLKESNSGNSPGSLSSLSSSALHLDPAESSQHLPDMLNIGDESSDLKSPGFLP